MVGPGATEGGQSTDLGFGRTEGGRGCAMAGAGVRDRRAEGRRPRPAWSARRSRSAYSCVFTCIHEAGEYKPAYGQ